MATSFSSFGRNVAETRRSLPVPAAVALLRTGNVEPGSLLAYGNGRTYGDSCQNVGGSVIDMRPANRVLSFDAESGLLEAEAGLLLSDIIAHVAPHGWFPAVLPGTQYVTLGGAIANDVHGKNHHAQGTFGCHVESLFLLRSDGQTYRCSRTTNATLFSATVGGMGLTGLIQSARIRLRRISSPDLLQTVRPFSSLDEYFALAEAADDANEYAVAWVDQLASGAREGRGILLTANHAHVSPARPKAERRQFSIPFRPPFTVLNRPFLKLFNAAYYRGKVRVGDIHLTQWRSFFFPLDGIRHWNRLYGPGGLYQHQSVLPPEAAQIGVKAMLAVSREAGEGSFLTVLKRFGATRSPGILSFPRQGYTLTLDFPNRGGRTLALLRELDRIAIASGGTVNPYKDARMDEHVFQASFPNWRALESLRDPAFLSDFWRRTALKLKGTEEYAHAAE
ncbi:MAG TPA: FAD-binding oxidoreductase [Rhizobiaceae bacterium]|nr:FAD-binding oxidoreductase [Rhizobiaceae bacterium]